VGSEMCIRDSLYTDLEDVGLITYEVAWMTDQEYKSDLKRCPLSR